MLDKLAAWKPQAIAIEALSGAQCDELRRYPYRYADTVESYCPDMAAARAATGLDIPAATAAFEKLLAAWPAAPTPAQRRHLTAMFLAGGEEASALVQWFRLPATEGLLVIVLRSGGGRVSHALLREHAPVVSHLHVYALVIHALTAPTHDGLHAHKGAHDMQTWAVCFMRRKVQPLAALLCPLMLSAAVARLVMRQL